MTGLKTWLEHPLTRGLDIDAPQTMWLRRQIIREKGFLRRIYQEWYADLAAGIPPGSGAVLELGSGAGFLRDVMPDVITTDLFECPGLQAVLDGQQLPMVDRALRGIVMVNVLHHMPHVRRLLVEAARCVRSGGVLAMLEPWATGWSRWVYTKLHHEPFQSEAADWKFPSSGPLSGANGALPWIIFERDRARFERESPEWRIESVRLTMPFRYVLSGGVSLRSLMPAQTFGLWRLIEQGLRPWMKTWAMFAQIRLVRT